MRLDGIKKGMRNPALLFPVLGRNGFFHGMSDERYLAKCFRARVGYLPDLAKPVTFNEKMQWLKLNDRNPLYTKLVDKVAVKSFVEERVGFGYVPETYHVWEKPEDVEIDSLPDRFVIKTNHDNAGVLICDDKSRFDLAAAKRRIAKHYSHNFFWAGREWPYLDVAPKVFAEEYLDGGSDGLVDYKLFCFSNGRIITLVMTDRFSNAETSKTFFDENWTPLPIKEGIHPTLPDMTPPSSFSRMKEIAANLSAGLPFVRVDFYQINGRPLLGEMTFYPNSGFELFEPREWDRVFGDWIDLSLAYSGEPGCKSQF